MALIYLSCAWLAGIFLGSKLAVPPVLVFSGLLPLPLLFVARQHRRAIVLTSLCLFVLFLGVFRFQSSLPGLRFYNGQEIVEVRGMLDRDPELRDKTNRLYFSADNITLRGVTHNVTGNALLIVPRYSDNNSAYSYGDLLRATGKLEMPPELDGFDYRAYLVHQEIYSVMFYPEIGRLDVGKGFKPLAWVYSLRQRLSQGLAEVLAEPQASLVQGVVLGIRGNIPAPVKDDFVDSGTAHLLAISGLHLSIIAGIMLSLGIRLFGKRGFIHVWLALAVIWIYALVSGMNPQVLRAAIMASLFLTTELLGRQRSSAAALALAAAVMVGINPQVLWDASFQMSFMAMAGYLPLPTSAIFS